MVKDSWYVVTSVALFLVSLAWTVYTIFSSIGTSCFNITNAYVTIAFLYAKIVWDNFVKPVRVE